MRSAFIFPTAQTVGESSGLHSFLQSPGCARGRRNILSLILQLRMTLDGGGEKKKKNQFATCYRVMFKAANLHSKKKNNCENCQASPSVISWISFLESPKRTLHLIIVASPAWHLKGEGEFILDSQTGTKGQLLTSCCAQWGKVTLMCFMSNDEPLTKQN